MDLSDDSDDNVTEDTIFLEKVKEINSRHKQQINKNEFKTELIKPKDRKND